MFNTQWCLSQNPNASYIEGTSEGGNKASGELGSKFISNLASISAEMLLFDQKHLHFTFLHLTR